MDDTADTRKLMRARLKQVSGNERQTAGAKVVRRLLDMPEYKRAKRVFSYVPMRTEIDVMPFMQQVQQDGKRLFIPRITGAGTMDAVFVPQGFFDKLTRADYGIPTITGTSAAEPDSLDFIVCPGLAFDRSGTRLGRGAGYYDRYLVNTNAFVIGAAYAFQLADELARNAWDIPVNAVVVPDETIYIAK